MSSAAVTLARTVLAPLARLRFWPHWRLALASPHRELILADVRRAAAVAHRERAPLQAVFVDLMAHRREFRTLYYYRLGPFGRLLAPLAPGMPTLFLKTPRERIGGGLYLQHAFSTIVTARSIGRDCWINQQVTIGHTDDDACPTIGDRVTIGAGALVLGDVTIGDGAVIGAGAVVVSDVAPGSVVGGVPARPLRDGPR